MSNEILGTGLSTYYDRQDEIPSSRVNPYVHSHTRGSARCFWQCVRSYLGDLPEFIRGGLILDISISTDYYFQLDHFFFCIDLERT